LLPSQLQVTQNHARQPMWNNHRNLSTRRSRLKNRGDFFSAGVQPILCYEERFCLSPVKMFLCSKLSCQQTFYKVFFAKNDCWTSKNILVLVPRVLW
jgi:hypothetical protein